MRISYIIGYYHRFHSAILVLRENYLRVTHPFAAIPCGIARLACLIHAASVHSEPGSNSPKKSLGKLWIMALMIHLYFKPHELTPKNSTKNSSWPRLAIQLSKEQTKKRPDKIVGTQNIYWRPYCRCWLITGTCQLRFNYFHNNLTLLKGNTYFNTKRFFVKNFFYLFIAI